MRLRPLFSDAPSCSLRRPVHTAPCYLIERSATICSMLCLPQSGSVGIQINLLHAVPAKTLKGSRT